MISICSNCGNHEWDKEVTGNKIKCPKCGYIWEFKKLPLYILTGCSGIGKTTAAQELQKMTDEIIITSTLELTMSLMVQSLIHLILQTKVREKWQSIY